MAAKTIGSVALPVSCRYDASAAAPAGLCAASISSSPFGGTRSHSSRAGHSHSVRPVTIASVGMWPTSVDQRSRIATATAAFSSWCRPGSAERQRRILPIRRRRMRVEERRLDLAGNLGDARGRLRRQSSDHERHARLRDAGLLERDLRQRVPEVSLVVEGDRGDRGDRRRQRRWSRRSVRRGRPRRRRRPPRRA